MKEQDELKPCPFCGKTAIVVPYTNGVAIECSMCKCSTEVFSSDDIGYPVLAKCYTYNNMPKTDFQKAFNAWNNRCNI